MHGKLVSSPIAFPTRKELESCVALSAMVNQMMNTLNKEVLLFSRKYRWDKKWVRPYESIFSILANFCRVNICSSKHALKMLGAEARFVFEHNFYHAEGIRCSPYEKGTGFNAYLLPLPCCRTNPNDFYDTDVTLLELAR